MLTGVLELSHKVEQLHQVGVQGSGKHSTSSEGSLEVSVPHLTPQQRTQALAKATQLRQARAQVREQLRTSPRVALPMVLQERRNDEIIGKMKVVTVLESLPGLGKVRAQRVMQRLGISPNRRMRGLGVNQIAALEREFDLDDQTGWTR